MAAQLVAATDLRVLVALAPKAAWLIAVALAVLVTRILLATAVVALVVAVAAGTAAAELARTAAVAQIVTVAVVVAVVPGRRVVLSLLAAMAVPPEVQVAVGECSLLIVQPLFRQHLLGTKQLAEI